MLIAMFPNTSKKNSKHLAISVKEFLNHRNVKVVVEDEDAEELQTAPLSSVDPLEIDFCISMGGDGTILRILHRHPALHAPIVGINMGSLGFMADIPVSDIYPSLQDLLNGVYKIQNRIVMDGTTQSGETLFAVNEMVIHRASNPCLIELAIHIDGAYLNTFAADGIIVSTPSGSTAYSLAAGGPILTPDIQAFVITPISPHTISNRPVVLLPSTELQIQYLSDLEPVELSADGITYHKLQTGEVFRITLSPRVFKLVSLFRHDYFTTLRTKLGWTGKLKHP